MRRLSSRHLKSEFLFLTVLLFLFIPAFSGAELFAKISPASGGESKTAYLNEVVEYNLTLFNDGEAPLDNIVLNLRADPSLVFVKNRAEVSTMEFKVPRIAPGERITEEFKVKSIALGTQKSTVTVDFGENTPTHSTSTFILVSDSPLEISARLEKSALSVGERNALLLGVKNSSNDELTGITASLFAPEGIYSESEPLSFNSLSPGQSISDKAFYFKPSSTTRGKQGVVLSVMFSDSKGVHLIERTFYVDIADRSITLYAIVLVIIVLIVLSYVVGKKTQSRKPPGVELKSPVGVKGQVEGKAQE